MTVTAADANRRIYEEPEVAAHYAALDYLTPCERLLFETYVPAGSAILDVGVGGGRTTSFLVNRASSYVGVDYAAAMVESCQTKFPGMEFVVADAADLSRFADASLDVVVFAFNGIDQILPDERRRSCLRHLHRILKPRGFLVFSSHNPRSIMIRPSWNRKRLREVAQRWSAGSSLAYWILWTSLTLLRAMLAVCRSAALTLLRAVRRIPTRMFWHGEGILRDPADGGVFTHYATPTCVVRELEAVSFLPVRVLGDDYPLASHPYVTDWYYYVFTKS